MRSIFISILFVIVTGTTAFSGPIGDFLNGLTGGNDYPGGPNDIKRKNAEIEEAMKKRQERIDAEDKQKAQASAKRQQLKKEAEQKTRDMYTQAALEMRKKYDNEYVNIDRYKYVQAAKNYDELLSNYSQRLNAKTSKLNKDNTAAASYFYNELGIIATTLDGIISQADKDDEAITKNAPKFNASEGYEAKRLCFEQMMREHSKAVNDGEILDTFEIRQKAYNDSLIKCGLVEDKSEKATVKTTSDYMDITQERAKIRQIMSEIYYDARSRENNLFTKLTGFSFDNDILGDFTGSLAFKLGTNQWTPTKGRIYRLKYMDAMQTITDGILATPTRPLVPTNPIFVATKEVFVDGQSLNSYYVHYTGNKKYQSLTGARNVYAFKIYEFHEGQIVKGKQFYFYPRRLDISGVVEIVATAAFGK